MKPIYKFCHFIILAICFILYYDEAYSANISPIQVHYNAISNQGNASVLRIFSSVSNSKVFINKNYIGEISSDIPMTIPLLAGNYLVSVSKDGYITYENSISMLNGKILSINAILPQALASIQVLSNIDGANVFINDKFIGQTPVSEFDGISEGIYKISIEKDGYSSESKTISISSGQTEEIKFDLKKITSNLILSILHKDLNNIKIFVDDKEIPSTSISNNISLSLLPGSHFIRIESSGFSKIYKSIQIFEDEELEIPILFDKQSGNLSVKTNIENANIYIEGSLVGNTNNLEINNIQEGTYLIKITKPSFVEYIAPITITARKQCKIEANLIPIQLNNES